MDGTNQTAEWIVETKLPGRDWNPATCYQGDPRTVRTRALAEQRAKRIRGFGGIPGSELRIRRTDDDPDDYPRAAWRFGTSLRNGYRWIKVEIPGRRATKNWRGNNASDAWDRAHGVR